MSSSILVLCSISLIFIFLIVFSHLFILGSKSFQGSRYLSTNNWYSSFECGFLNYGLNENFFSFSYLNLLILFVVFDLEISLLLNIVYDGVWLYTFWCNFFFFFFVFLGYMIELNLGYVKWIN
uniref:NADH-ubiquinone oxidoreductase chain 3 n=1 Tax=Schistosoma indicum TaxID=216970 RepID=A0A6G9KDA3_9TREM|nr:NADH dehydrogenase subunit 3 [Schistosoma indicum]QIQ48869.1 NADH dehydrogenase subunit 3 [Schistosoma indicum]